MGELDCYLEMVGVGDADLDEEVWNSSGRSLYMTLDDPCLLDLEVSLSRNLELSPRLTFPSLLRVTNSIEWENKQFGSANVTGVAAANLWKEVTDSECDYSPLFPSESECETPIEPNLQEYAALTLTSAGSALLFTVTRAKSFISSSLTDLPHYIGLVELVTGARILAGRVVNFSKEALILCLDRGLWAVYNLQINCAGEKREVSRVSQRGILIAPVDWQNASSCFVCAVPFSFSKFRHTCRCCGHSFCETHATQRRKISFSAFPVRVCDVCATVHDSETDKILRNQRVARVRSYLQDSLEPYRPPKEDGTFSKMKRASEGLLAVVRHTLGVTSYPTRIVVELLSILQTYGASGIIGIAHSGEFAVALQQLQKIAGLKGKEVLALHSLSAAVFYKLAIDRRERGCAPELALKEHHGFGVENSYISPGVATTTANGDCGAVSGALLETAARLAPLAIFGSYQVSLVEMQQAFLSMGFTTIYASLDAALDKPSFALVATKKIGAERQSVELEAILVIRGTHSIEDLLTDLRSQPCPYPPSDNLIDDLLQGSVASDALRDYVSCLQQQGCSESVPVSDGSDWEWLDGPRESSGTGYACKGMVQAALYLLKEIGPDLILLQSLGFKVLLVGHSLGGSVAALLLPMLRRHVPGITGWGFANPCCCDLETAISLTEMTSVVLEDDVVVRISPRSIRQLLAELAALKSVSGALLAEDAADVARRISEIWRPRARGEAVAIAAVGEDAQSLDTSGLNCNDRKVDNSTESVLTHMMNRGGEKSDSEPPQGDKLREIYLPGMVVHLYEFRGVMLAAQVPTCFRALRTIRLSSTIFEDHLGYRIFDALKDALGARVYRQSQDPSGPARLLPVPWTSHDSSPSTCRLCFERFSWGHTLRGTVAEWRLTHNCTQCGILVCEACSSHSLPVGYGSSAKKRVCDSCFFCPLP